MSIVDYVVNRDNFKFVEINDFDFPCCICEHRHKNEDCNECNSCDHNLNAEPEGKNIINKCNHTEAPKSIGDWCF